MPSASDADRLVPAKTVESALLCAYVGSNTKTTVGLRLSDHAVLGGDLTQMVQELRWLPPQIDGQGHTCTLRGGPQTNFLTQLTFTDDTTVWVAAADDPNGCVGTTNGRFTSQQPAGEAFAKATKAGEWVPSSTVSGTDRCVGGARYGQQTAMVPAGAVSVEICSHDASNKLTHAAARSGFQSLITALNAEPTVPSSSSCHDTSYDAPTTGKPKPSTMYTAVFRYPSGPPVAVQVIPTCVPAIDNSSLQAADASTVTGLLKALLVSAGQSGAR